MPRQHDPQLISGLESAAADLEQQVRNARTQGDLRATLEAQAYTLDHLFRLLGSRATRSRNASEAAVLLRLGLRAQAQCVLTAKAVAELPGAAPKARAEELARLSDEQLAAIAGVEDIDENLLEWMDAGTASGTSESDSTLEALDEEHWAEDA